MVPDRNKKHVPKPLLFNSQYFKRHIEQILHTAGDWTVLANLDRKVNFPDEKAVTKSSIAVSNMVSYCEYSIIEIHHE